jgi:hypothetical protein
MARLCSGGGAEKHGWVVDTAKEGGKTLKQQKKMGKNHRKGKRKRKKGGGRKITPSLLP